MTNETTREKTHFGVGRADEVARPVLLLRAGQAEVVGRVAEELLVLVNDGAVLCSDRVLGGRGILVQSLLLAVGHLSARRRTRISAIHLRGRRVATHLLRFALITRGLV